MMSNLNYNYVGYNKMYTRRRLFLILITKVVFIGKRPETDVGP